jgi:hypothetical protein
VFVKIQKENKRKKYFLSVIGKYYRGICMLKNRKIQPTHDGYSTLKIYLGKIFRIFLPKGQLIYL